MSELNLNKKIKPVFFLWAFVILIILGGGLYFYLLPPASKPLSMKSLSSSASAKKDQDETVNIIQGSLKPAGQDYAPLQKTYWIEQGDAAAPQKLYVVLDPNCIFCHQLFNELQPLIDDHKVAVRWVLIGAIRPSSPDKAKAIMTAKDPLEALKYNEANFKEEIEEGGIVPVSEVSPEALENYEKNMRFAIDIQLEMTPISFFFDTAGNFVRHNGGALDKQFIEMMKHVGGDF